MNEASIKQSPGSEQAGWNLIFACWILATVATLGSLFFSEIMGLKPCVLCWWQRIFMYPLVVILLVGMYPLDRRVVRYALPLAVIGLAFAFYHYLVYSGYIPESLQPCDQEASCAEIDLELFGFITIPMMSIISYTAIIVMLVMFRNKTQQNGPNQDRMKE
jgi:disulfide bond formation protein DsbB